MLKCYSNFGILPEVEGEYNDGESDVDLALYMPIGRRIEEYIRAGENLEDTKRLQYHSDMLENLQDDKYTDPMLYRGYDRTDLELMHKEAIEEILASRRNSDLSTRPQAQSVEKDAIKPVDNVDKPEVSPEVENLQNKPEKAE